MNALYDVPAPAKLNLFLHVTGRRPDGYHLLQSVFMLMDWYDTLHFETRSGGQITREDQGPALPADDLTVRAARALQTASGTRLGAHIVVQKRIPAQAAAPGPRRHEVRRRRLVRRGDVPAGAEPAVAAGVVRRRTVPGRPYPGCRRAVFHQGSQRLG